MYTNNKSHRLVPSAWEGFRAATAVQRNVYRARDGQPWRRRWSISLDVILVAMHNTCSRSIDDHAGSQRSWQQLNDAMELQNSPATGWIRYSVPAKSDYGLGTEHAW
jgi:hypothetical protein